MPGQVVFLAMVHGGGLMCMGRTVAVLGSDLL
jgi:hypothetical protein